MAESKGTKGNSNLNVYAEEGFLYFPVPQFIFDPDHQPSQKAMLYFMFAMYIRNKNGGRTRPIRSGTILRALGFDKRAFKSAREEAFERKLLKSTQTERGVWLLEPMNPTTGEVIGGKPDFHGADNFDNQSPETLRAFFESYGLELKGDNQASTHCPFHHYRSGGRSLSINLAEGGMWNCHVCGFSGKLTGFEQAWADKFERRQLSGSEAAKRVRARLNKAELKHQEKTQDAFNRYWDTSHPDYTGHAAEFTGDHEVDQEFSTP